LLCAAHILTACSEERVEPRLPSAPPASAERTAAAPIESQDQDLAWRPWSNALQREAAEQDRPILLYFSAPGWDGVFAEDSPALRVLVQEHFIAAHVDPYEQPETARRFAPGGWPALVVMLPDATPFAVAVDPPAAGVRLYLRRLLEAYQTRRDVIEAKASRAQMPQPPRRHYRLDTDAVYRACVTAYDSTNGGFGGGRKHVEATAMAFLLEYSRTEPGSAALAMVRRTVGALLRSPMMDTAHGGVQAFSYTPDWSTPAGEKDAADQALLLELLLAGIRDGEDDWAPPARALLRYVRAELFSDSTGAFSGRQVRTAAGGWWTDPRIFADRQALLVRACAGAATELGDPSAAEMARKGAAYLLETCMEDGVVHQVCGSAGTAGALSAQAAAGLGLLEAAAAGGDPRLRAAARGVAAAVQARLEQSGPGAAAGAQTIGLAPGTVMPILSYTDGQIPAGAALAAELFTQLGDGQRARGLMAGAPLPGPPSRHHSAMGRVQLKLQSQTL
jgi:uncharacterized protein YyaL (SSP411 family)